MMFLMLRVETQLKLIRVQRQTFETETQSELLELVESHATG